MNTVTIKGSGHDDPLRILEDELRRAGEMLSGLGAGGGDGTGGAGPLDAPLAHIASCEGKMLRPLLTLACGHASDDGHDHGDRCVQAAVAVELLHVGTLCHDDVMDEAPTRRGAASTNVRWGNAVAILCGDVLIARSIVTVTRLGPTETAVLARTLEDLCQGQATETATLWDHSRTVADYLRCIELKTASLFAASSQLGSLAAGADLDRSRVFAEFGRLLGIAFQIVDDVLDLVGSEEMLGKAPGSDLREGVFTLPVIDAMARVPALRDLVAPPMVPERAERARALVLASGAIEAALERVRGLVADAAGLLATLPGADIRYIDPLMRMAENVLERGISSVATAMPQTVVDAARRWGDGALTGAGRTGGGPGRPDGGPR